MLAWLSLEGYGGRKYPEVLKYGTPKTINFPFIPNGKLMALYVPIFKLLG